MERQSLLNTVLLGPMLRQIQGFTQVSWRPIGSSARPIAFVVLAVLDPHRGCTQKQIVIPTSTFPPIQTLSVPITTTIQRNSLKIKIQRTNNST